MRFVSFASWGAIVPDFDRHVCGPLMAGLLEEFYMVVFGTLVFWSGGDYLCGTGMLGMEMPV